MASVYLFVSLMALFFGFAEIFAFPQACDQVCTMQVCPQMTSENCDGTIIPKSCGQCCPVCQPRPRPRFQCRISCVPFQCSDITSENCNGTIIPAHSPCNCCPYCKPI